MITLKKKRSFDLSKNEEIAYYKIGNFVNDSGVPYSTLVIKGTYTVASMYINRNILAEKTIWFEKPIEIEYKTLCEIAASEDPLNQLLLVNAEIDG